MDIRDYDVAREYLPHLGISHRCGHGLEVAGELPELLRDLREGADRLGAEPAG